MLTVYQLTYDRKELIRIDNSVSDKEICPICRERFLNKNLLKTDCGHLFHLSCLKDWINSKHSVRNQCPLCRRDISALKPALDRLPLYDVNEQLASAMYS